MWQLGFFFHEMASSLLSVFLPLYIIAIGGSLVDVGIMSSSAVFLTIPSSFFWGYICDKTGRYKRYILISFLASTVLLYLFTLTTGVVLLIILYAAMSILHVAHEPPKNVLISELYTREEWEKTFAFYEGFTQTGRLIGLLLGLFMSIYGIGAGSTLILCSGLNLVACIMSLILVTDPLLVFERSLVRIEKAIDFTYNGVVIASKILDGLSLNERLKKENLRQSEGLEENILEKKPPSIVCNQSLWACSAVSGTSTTCPGGPKRLWRQPRRNWKRLTSKKRGPESTI